MCYMNLSRLTQLTYIAKASLEISLIWVFNLILVFVKRSEDGHQLRSFGQEGILLEDI